MQRRIFEARYRVCKMGFPREYRTADGGWTLDPDLAKEYDARTAYKLVDELNKDYYGPVPPHTLVYIGAKKIR